MNEQEKPESPMEKLIRECQEIKEADPEFEVRLTEELKHDKS